MMPGFVIYYAVAGRIPGFIIYFAVAGDRLSTNGLD